MTASHGLRVGLRLPTAWRVLPVDEWPREALDATHLQHADLDLEVPGPDLVATCFAPVATDDDAVERLHGGDVSAADYLLLAGLTLTSVPLAEVPEHLRGHREPWVSRRRIAIGSVEASFDVGTYLHVDLEHEMAALLTISTPNLEQSAELIDGVRQLADTIEFQTVGP